MRASGGAVRWCELRLDYICIRVRRAACAARMRGRCGREKEFKVSVDAGDQVASLVDDFLDKARQEAEAGTPSSVRVRTLVRLFGSERRGANVVRRMQQE